MRIENINLMIPTFKRCDSGKLPRCLDSFIRLADAPQNLRVTLLINESDEETHKWLETAPSYVQERGNPDQRPFFSYVYARYDKPDIGWFYNTLYEHTKFQDEDTAVTLIGDDMVAMTTGWDVEVLAALNRINGMGIVHCRDGIQNGKIGVNLFTTRAWVRATGGKFMEDFPVDFIDVIYTEVARRTGHEVYLDNVFIDHQHSSLQPQANWDEGFRGLRAQYAKYGPEVTARAEACIARQIASVRAAGL